MEMIFNFENSSKDLKVEMNKVNESLKKEMELLKKDNVKLAAKVTEVDGREKRNTLKGKPNRQLPETSKC